MSAIFILLLIAALVVGRQCPMYNTDNDIFNMETLPYQCSSVIGGCPESLCVCLGGSGFNATSHTCQGDITTDTTCDDVNFCMRLYTLCVGVSYNFTNATCAGSWWDFIQEQTVHMLVSPETYNTTAMYQSCAGYTCKWVNATYPSCDVNYPLACFAPYVPVSNTTQPPVPIPTGAGITPAPTNSLGQFVVPVKRLRLIAIFIGQFKSLLESGNTTAIANLYAAVGASFSAYLGYPFVCTNATDGSLIVTVDAHVPSSQTTVLSALESSVNRLNTETSSAWYSSVVVACVNGGACPTGVSSPTLKSFTITDATIGTPNPAAPVEQKCSSGCVAGIIIACIAVVVIITAVTCVIVRRSAEQSATTGFKEPASAEMNSNPMKV